MEVDAAAQNALRHQPTTIPLREAPVPHPSFPEMVKDYDFISRNPELGGLMNLINSVMDKVPEEHKQGVQAQFARALAAATVEVVTTTCGRADKALKKAVKGSTPTKERPTLAGQALAHLHQPHNVVPVPDGVHSSIAARVTHYIEAAANGNQDNLLASLLKLDDIQLPANKVQPANVESRFKNAFKKLDEASKLALHHGDRDAAAELMHQLANAHEMWAKVFQPLCTLSTSTDLPLQLLSDESLLCTAANAAETPALAFLANLRNPAYKQAVKTLLADKLQQERADGGAPSPSRKGRGAWGRGKGDWHKHSTGSRTAKDRAYPKHGSGHKTDKKEGQ